MKVKKRFS